MKKKLVVLSILIVISILLYRSGATQYLTLTYLKSNIDSLKQQIEVQPALFTLSFFGVYILSTAISLPGATILTLAAGALFGLTKGFIIVSFASTFGATLAMLISRFFLRNWVQSKFSDKLKMINEGIDKEGAFYLFTLRLAPLFPFFLVNLAMGLTNIRLITYFFISQLGMVLGTLVYVNAGVEISKIDSLSGILTPKLFLAFTLLGILPIISKKIINSYKARRVYKRFKKPAKFDYDMIAIGGGAAGLVTSFISAAVKAKVALIEKHQMGGDCLNTGCVPSKAIIKSASIAHLQNSASKYGFEKITTDFEFKKIMNRVHNVIHKIEPHDSRARYTSLGVDCIEGEAKILSPWEVQVNGKVLTTRNITIATGASPFVPPLKGIDQVKFRTSENLWQMESLPKKFVVLGGGPIGLEMAQSFARLGSQVTVVEMSPRIMIREDEDVSLLITQTLEHEGIKILTSTKAIGFEDQALIVETARGIDKIEFDEILIAIGRRPRTKGFGLEELAIPLRKNGTIETNDYLQTIYPNIFACGDVTGPYQLTHMAGHQAWYCAVNGIFGFLKKFKVDYSAVPWSTYTDPQVATVGLTENAAKEKGIAYELTKYGIDDLDRAIADSADHGFIKVLTKPGSDQILGATIVGVQAGDLISEFTLAVKWKLGLNKILSTIHPYPTMAESLKYTAGAWKQNHKPEWVMPWLTKFHAWRRG